MYCSSMKDWARATMKKSSGGSFNPSMGVSYLTVYF